MAPSEPHDQRLNRLEEHAAFAERTVEQLSEELLEINRRLREVSRRVDALERRLARLSEPADETGGPATPE